MTASASKAPSVKALGYIGYEARDTFAWDGFLRDIFGLERRADSPEGCLQYRVDEHHHRISVHAGSGDGVRYIGWEMASREALVLLEAHLRERGVAVERGSKALADERGVLELISFDNPDGMLQEACFGVALDDKPFHPTRPLAGYRTADFGLGHVALMTRDHHAAAAWYQEMLGFRLSDVVEAGPMQATFMHCNGRHHSLGLINEIPGMFPAGTINHLMLEGLTLDDVGRGYDIALDRGYPVALTLGQHANDQMTSFYAYTPSGSAIEYGHGGVVVDDATWTSKYFNTGDLWGHKLQPPPAKWSPGLRTPNAVRIDQQPAQKQAAGAAA